MPSYTHHRARLASLSRLRDSDDPEILSERQKLAEEKLINAVGRALAAAPPLSDEVRQRIVGLLSMSDNDLVLIGDDVHPTVARRPSVDEGPDMSANPPANTRITRTDSRPMTDDSSCDRMTSGAET